MSKKHFNFKSSIRDWYIRAFPSDELGYRINPLATFAGAVKCMAGADDLYPTPVRAFTYNGRDEEPDHRTDVHLDGDMVLDGQMTAETPAHVPADITAAAKEAAAKSVKPDTVGTDGIKH